MEEHIKTLELLLAKHGEDTPDTRVFMLQVLRDLCREIAALTVNPMHKR